MIAAAGSGERLGAGGPKAFVEVGGKPMLDWSLAAFEAAESVGAVIVAVPSGMEGEITAPGVEAVEGGAARSQSVAAALERVDTEIVAVHDAARPLVTGELIDATVALLAGSPDAAAVIAATAVTDTVKEAGEDHVVQRTLDRTLLWAVQTPQVFRTERLREALAADPQELATATDDAMLVEKAGGKVLIHPSPSTNLKVTTPEDLRIAELLL